jgi:hypothetical protein
MTELATPNIVTREEWERARAELLVREKAHTRAGDDLAAARRRLPMTRMEPVTVGLHERGTDFLGIQTLPPLLGLGPGPVLRSHVALL